MIYNYDFIEQTGLLVVLSSPSGAGKTTIYNNLLDRNDEFEYSISVTTRKPRKNEEHKRSYHFVKENRFKEKIENDEFAEWAEVHGNYYGTLNSTVESMLEQSKICLFDLDVQGGLTMKEKFEETILIFILPPSFEELKSRLTARGLNSQEDLELRLKNAAWELSFWDKYDHLVINDQLEHAVQQVENIIEVAKLDINNIRNLNWKIPQEYKGG